MKSEEHVRSLSESLKKLRELKEDELAIQEMVKYFWLGEIDNLRWLCDCIEETIQEIEDELSEYKQ